MSETKKLFSKKKQKITVRNAVYSYDIPEDAQTPTVKEILLGLMKNIIFLESSISAKFAVKNIHTYDLLEKTVDGGGLIQVFGEKDMHTDNIVDKILQPNVDFVNISCIYQDTPVVIGFDTRSKTIHFAIRNTRPVDIDSLEKVILL